METEPTTPRPTPEEAAAALREAESAQESTRAVKVPAWYYPVLGLIIAPYGLLFVIPHEGWWLAAYLLGLVAFLTATVVLMRVGVNQMGVLRWLTPRELRPIAVWSLFPIIGGIGLYLIHGTPWAWVATTAGLGVAIGLFGPYHRRTSPYYQTSGNR
ncbi:hypothetical protein KIK06_27925 [Nocardiopsis sp. EMB25]|uniref:hypothetical protein n=1 Tax=Nocardiopsis sp. EMB25 TaxID=2835867 RepID=UPI002283CE7A|nr:hypothetical protein [Nocardiopsis sp. EMB25]MCY9787712.1 hypothetical protein [Nocardiopsis sp. EMB25]